MAGPGLVTLASLRIQAQERSDQLNSSFLSVSEWNRNIMGSYKELYDLLIAAYGTDYYVNTPVTFPTTGQVFLYPLPDGTTTFTSGITGLTVTPPAFYKLLGVDLQLSPGIQGSYVTIKPFNFSQRNRYAVPNFQSFYGVTNLRYRLEGNNLWLNPIPAGGQIIQLWYIPRPADLQAEVIVGITSASTTVTCTDTSNLTVGMQVQIPGNNNLLAFALGTTISSITPNVSFVTNSASTITAATQLLRAWFDSTVVDGVSGWEEYIVLDAALKSYGKEEDEPSLLVAQKAAMMKRLIDMAANRDAGFPATVSDTQDVSDLFLAAQGSSWGAG